jgi:integrase
MVSKTIVAQVTVGSNPTPSAANEQVRGRIVMILSLAARRTLSIRERRGRTARRINSSHENVEGTRPVPHDRFGYAWREIDEAVDDGAHVRLHDLRHFQGTMLVGAGVPSRSVPRSICAAA